MISRDRANEDAPVDDSAKLREDEGRPEEGDDKLHGRFYASRRRRTSVSKQEEGGKEGKKNEPCNLISSGKRPKTPAVVARTKERKWLSSSTAVRLKEERKRISSSIRHREEEKPTNLSGTKNNNTAFSCTCHPHKKLVIALSTTASKNLL